MKIGFTCSAFDLLHAGHILMLEEAKSVCDYLVVGLHTDPSTDRPHKRRPYQSLIERYIQLSAVKYVDEIIVYETEKDLYDILTTRKIDIRIIGADHQHQETWNGKELHLKEGTEIYYNSRRHNYSSTELIERIQAKPIQT